MNQELYYLSRLTSLSVESRKEIYLPWKNFAGHNSLFHQRLLSSSPQIVEKDLKASSLSLQQK
jgi:hypothetical protein